MKKKKIIAIVLCALLVVGLGVGAGVIIYNNTPEVVAAHALSGVFDDLTERQEINAAYNMLRGGSLSMSVSELEADGEEYPEDFEVSYKLYFSPEAFMLENLKLALGDMKLNGDVYVSKDLIYVSEDEILDGSYGISMKDLVKEFEDSIFAYGSDSPYAVPDEETHNQIVEYLEKAEGVDDVDAEKLSKDAEKLFSKLYEDLYKIVCEHAEFTSEKDEIRLGGEKTKVRVITIVIDEEALSNIIQGIYDYLEDDDEIPAFLEEYEAVFNNMISVYFPNEDSIVDAYDELLEQWGDQLDDMCDAIEDDKFELKIEMATPKMFATLLMLSVELDDEELFRLDFGKDGLAKTNIITLEAGGEKIVYEIEADDKNEYVASLTALGEEVFSVEVDRKKETYEMKFGPKNAENVTISGKLAVDGDETTITLAKIVMREMDWDPETYEEYYATRTVKTNFKMVISEKDKIPAAPKKYDTISDITDEDIEGWITKFDEMEDAAEEIY